MKEVVNEVVSSSMTLPEALVICVIIIVMGVIIWKFIDGILG